MHEAKHQRKVIELLDRTAGAAGAGVAAAETPAFAAFNRAATAAAAAIADAGGAELADAASAIGSAVSHLRRFLRVSPAASPEGSSTFVSGAGADDASENLERFGAPVSTKQIAQE